MPYAIAAVLIIGSTCAAVGTTLLKIGASGHTQVLAFVNVYTCSGLTLYGLGAVCWIYAMSTQDLISVYPFTMLSFLLVYLFGIAALGERPTGSAAAGIVLILAGLYLIARGPA